MESPSLLHVGCGGDPLPGWLGKYNETRLDIDESHNPDIVGDMRDLSQAGKYDAIYCSHALEHLSPHEVVPALKGFLNALNDGGAVVLFVPDLEDVKATDEVLFDAPAGPICGLDLIYGYRKMLKDKPYMAHKTGFTSKTLHNAFTEAGFKKVAVSRLSDYALMGAAVK
jgi:hypothetical protein